MYRFVAGFFPFISQDSAGCELAAELGFEATAELMEECLEARGRAQWEQLAQGVLPTGVLMWDRHGVPPDPRLEGTGGSLGVQVDPTGRILDGYGGIAKDRVDRWIGPTGHITVLERNNLRLWMALFETSQRGCGGCVPARRSEDQSCQAS